MSYELTEAEHEIIREVQRVCRGIKSSYSPDGVIHCPFERFDWGLSSDTYCKLCHVWMGTYDLYMKDQNPAFSYTSSHPCTYLPKEEVIEKFWRNVGT